MTLCLKIGRIIFKHKVDLMPEDRKSSTSLTLCLKIGGIVFKHKVDLIGEDKKKDSL